MEPKEAYQSLMSDADKFLRKYPVKVWGAPGASGVRRFAIQRRSGSSRPGRILGKLNMHPTDFWTIKPAGSATPGVPSYEFDAHCIAVAVGIGNETNYNLQGGPDLLVTTELTGCSFVVRQQTHSLNAVHIQPPPGTGGEALQNALRATPGNTSIYGRGNYNHGLRAASIVGVRRAGQWKIYAQKNYGPANGDHHIKSVHMIWPTHRKV